MFFSKCDIGSATSGVVRRERTLFQRDFAAGNLHDKLRQFADGEFSRITDVDGTDEIRLVVHQPKDPFDQIIAITERASLFTFAKNGDRLSLNGLPNEIRYDSSIVRVHTWTVGIEDSYDPDVDFV